MSPPEYINGGRYPELVPSRRNISALDSMPSDIHSARPSAHHSADWVELGVEVDLEMVGFERPPVVLAVLDLVLTEVLRRRGPRRHRREERQRHDPSEPRPGPDLGSWGCSMPHASSFSPPVTCCLKYR